MNGAQGDQKRAGDPFPEPNRRSVRRLASRPWGHLLRSGLFRAISVVRVGEWYGVEVYHKYFSRLVVSRWCAHCRHRLRPAGFEPATKGFKGPRVSARLGLSHPPLCERRPGVSMDSKDRAVRAVEEAGRSRRGLLLGLTPLVSEPSWPPKPGQARLRIAMPIAVRPRKAKCFRFRFPAIHPVRDRKLPFAATFF
jgi:hypothetical protein